MLTKAYIKRIFPELTLIKSKSLMTTIVKIWLLASRRGNWQKIDDIPFTLLIPTSTSLIEHTRRVTHMAISVAKTRKKLKMDILIAGAITHDVGKLLEYERIGKNIVKSKSGVRHPVSGYRLAIEVGLPHKVAHIILTHSHEGDKIARTQEAIVVHHCDFIDFEIEKRATGCRIL